MRRSHNISILIFFIILFLFSQCSQKNAVQTLPVEPLPEKMKENNPEVREESLEMNLLETGDPAKIMEDALETYQEARLAWEKGDTDAALNALDEAYGLILKLDISQDSTLQEEKNELRLLIAQRIQEIYASHLVAVGENGRFIQLEENQYVMREIKSFQTRERSYFMGSYQRSGRYISMMKEEFRKAGLPEDLAWIPVIESGFKIRAYSRARALGLWQFIASTGYRFGLKRDRWVDERMDPVKATKAAVQYLKELHSYFGDWATALAAYNCGEFRVQRVIRAQKINYLDNFWDLFLMLPRETSRFAPRYIAVLMIIQNPDKYGFQLPEPDPPIEFDTITVNKPMRLSDLDLKLSLQPGTLANLNPELRHKATPGQEYQLKIPRESGDQVLAAVEAMSKYTPPEASYVIHYVRRGETVSGIARRYRTSISSIARLNRLRRNFLIRPGQRLKIPSRGRRISSYSPPSAPKRYIKHGEKISYRVKRGDSLYSIASRFHTTVQQIKKSNQLASNILSVGQELVLESTVPSGVTVYVVKSGDTPYTISQRFSMGLTQLLSLNRLTRRSRIYPGQQLWVIEKKN